jgi:O-antigen/teichoic acid export membrane protein
MVKNFANLGLIQITNSLLQILLFPLIFRIVGVEEFGKVMVANSFAWLLAVLVTWGSNQSGINDIATTREEPLEMSRHFRVILQSRMLIFSFLLLLVLGWYGLQGANGYYFLLAMPIVLGEAINPLFYFVGKETTSQYNIFNVVSKLLTFGLMLLCIKHAEQGAWVNFLIGISNTLFFSFLVFREYYAKRIFWLKVSLKQYRDFFRSNSFLVGNNMTVYLQQSIFLFALSATGQAAVLGAYSLCDKLIWTFRIMMVAFFNAVFPKGALLFDQNPEHWYQFKKKINRLMAGFFLFWAVGQFLLADTVIFLVAGKSNDLAAHYLKWMSLVPLLIALNSLNVLELYLERKNKAIFQLGLGILSCAAITTFVLLKFQHQWYGLFLIFVEGVSLFLYTIYLKRIKLARPNKV